MTTETKETEFLVGIEFDFLDANGSQSISSEHGELPRKFLDVSLTGEKARRT